MVSTSEDRASDRDISHGSGAHIESEKSIDLGEPNRTSNPEGPSEEAKTENDVPPNGGYGWVCTACCFLINAHTWGVNSVCSFAELLPFMKKNKTGSLFTDIWRLPGTLFVY